MTHDEYVNTLKSAVTNLVVKSVLSVLTAYLPWMAWGPFRYIATKVVSFIINIAVNQTELAIFLKYTDVRVNKQGEAFNLAAAKNFTAQQTGTPEEKLAAEKELVDSFRAFVKFSN